MGRILSATQAAEVLHIRKDVVLTMLETGEIPAVRIGRRWKINEDMLESWFTERALDEAFRRRRKTNEEKGNNNQAK